MAGSPTTKIAISVLVAGGVEPASYAMLNVAGSYQRGHTGAPVVTLTPFRHPVGLGEPFASKAPGWTPAAGCFTGLALKPGTFVSPSTATTLPPSAAGTNAGCVVAKYVPPFTEKPCSALLNAFSTVAADAAADTSMLFGGTAMARAQVLT